MAGEVLDDVVVTVTVTVLFTVHPDMSPTTVMPDAASVFFAEHFTLVL